MLYSIHFLQTSTQAENELLVSKISKKIVGHGSCFEEKVCGKLVSFRKIVACKTTWSPDFFSLKYQRGIYRDKLF